VGESSLEHKYPGLAAELLDTPLSRWRKTLERRGAGPADDPVPASLVRAIPNINVVPLLEAVRGLPSNWSVNARSKVHGVATALNHVISGLWEVWLSRASFRSPLLILDEAHHAKNRYTQLASLFVHDEDRGEGALLRRFERMLFLTATPFQLGHGELIEVLSRFQAVDWSTLPTAADGYASELRDLERKLGAAEAAAAELDRSWGRLRDEDRPDRDQWWLPGPTPDGSARLSQTQRAYVNAERAMREAEQALKPWVIRHRKPDAYPSGEPRRSVLRGAQIIDENRDGGIDIAEGELLPFLLAGRAQAAFRSAYAQGRLAPGARALFADGLCSSFEAYRDTRGAHALDEDAEPIDGKASDPEVMWYLNAISNALPRDGTARHPKLDATVHQAVSLWERGEKVVIFCHFRRTGRALRRELSAAIDERLRASAARTFRVEPKDVPRTLERLSDRLFVRKGEASTLAREAHHQLAEIVARSRYPTAEEREKLTDRFLRYLRSPVTLARYGSPLRDGGPKAISKMLSGKQIGDETLHDRFNVFVDFFDGRTSPERDELLEALRRVQSGRYHAARAEIEGEDIDEHEPAELLPTVRLANGGVPTRTRRRLLLAFNSPLLPEVLVASSVLAEGVDLHIECRHVIHHDLDWSPSTLEQRTGRVDRIGSLAERTKEPVTVYLPYLAATQDEKMYRVVRDRERWFQVVMGARHELDEQALEQIASRVELPDAAATALALDLTVS
jgi:superfamily II DNA or RNA helicase